MEKMNNNLKIQLSILIGIFGFFWGGIFNLKKEIIDIVLSASIGWALSFFITYFILGIFIKKDNNQYKKYSKDNIKGKKIDVIISNNLDEIYNLKR
ncbi:MAG: hypothetical protein KA120_07960 [Candidatus Goldbacteria bacterium]|nr:hypothetical protein [Candidatus Goldiibacteriota bacterium]